MKKLPYTSCFVVVQINDSIKKMFFDEVIDYKDYSSPDFDEHKKCMAQMAFVDDSSADELLVLLCQAYLNSKEVIDEFETAAKKTCEKTSDMCATLVVDMHMKDYGTATIQIVTLANDEKRDAFNYIAQYVSEEYMDVFVKTLTVKQQDLLFDFA